MKAVFAHDHIFRQDIKGNYYTAGSFNNTVWKRYLNFFQKLTILARLDKERIKKENTYNDFDLPDVTFKAVPSLSGPLAILKNKHVATEIIETELNKADFL